MRKLVLLIMFVTSFLIFEDNVKAAPSGDGNFTKNYVCTTNDIYERLESVNSYNAEVELTYDLDEGNDVKIDDECSGEAEVETKKMKQEYLVTQTGDFVFNIDKGPIFSGGGFRFGIKYTNTIKWQFKGRLDECKKVKVKNYEYQEEFDEEGNVVSTSCTGEIEVEPTHSKGVSGGLIDLEDKCDSSAGIMQLYEEQVNREILRELNETTKVTMPKDNNSIKNKGQTSDRVGTWKCEPQQIVESAIVNDDGSVEFNKDPFNGTLKANQLLETECSYELYDAFINRQTGDVVTSKTSTYNSVNYIEKPGMYFIPLKWTGPFSVSVDFGELSTNKKYKWDVKYTCDVETKQFMYDLENGGYKFFYRPIDITNPFPNREPSTNWKEWWSKEENKTSLANSYGNKEYTVSFTPNVIENIKQFNNVQTSSAKKLGYLDTNINGDGTTNFFSKIDGIKFTRSTSDYEKLGAGPQ